MTSKSVASRSCDWLHLILAMRARGTPLTRTNGKTDEYQGIWGWDKKLANIHWLVDTTMTMWESYLTKPTWKRPEQLLVGAFG